MIRNLLFSIALLVGLSLVLSACDADSRIGSGDDIAEGPFAAAQTNAVVATSICKGIWRFDNGTASSAEIDWRHQSSSTDGMFDIGAGKTLYLRTRHVEGDRNRLRFSVDGRGNTQVNSTNAACTYSLKGRVSSNVDASVNTGLSGLNLILQNPNKSATTDAHGAYHFDGLTLGATSTLNWGSGDATQVARDYYVVQSPGPFPYTIDFKSYPGLDVEGATASSLDAIVLNIVLTIQPNSIRAAFDQGRLEPDDNDDQFWWQQVKRALGGDGGQNNAVVNRELLVDLLKSIQGRDDDGIDHFYDVPFQFGTNPNEILEAAAAILQPPDNRNTSQSRFESALLTVWLNRVYDTRINKALLDGLLLGAEDAYRSEFGIQIISPLMTVDGYATPSSSSAAVSSLSDFESALTSTYRSGSGGIGSN